MTLILAYAAGLLTLINPCVLPVLPLVLAAFALGVSSVILVIGYGARVTIRRHQGWLRALAERAKPITGAIFLGVGAVLLTGLHHRAEAWLISVLPAVVQDFSVSI